MSCYIKAGNNWIRRMEWEQLWLKVVQPVEVINIAMKTCDAFDFYFFDENNSFFADLSVPTPSAYNWVLFSMPGTVLYECTHLIICLTL